MKHESDPLDARLSGLRLQSPAGFVQRMLIVARNGNESSRFPNLPQVAAVVLPILTIGAVVLALADNANRQPTASHLAVGTAASASPELSPSPSTSATAPIASPQPSPATATLGSWTGIKPSIIYFSGDSGNIVTSILWSSWDDQSAVGHGTWGYNNCQPSCATGTVVQYQATVTLTNPSGGQFTQVIESQSGPYGRSFTFTLPNRGLSAAP